MPQQELDTLLKEVESDTVGLIRLNHRGIILRSLMFVSNLQIFVLGLDCPCY